MSKQASGKAYEARMAKVVKGRHIRRTSYSEPAADIEHDQLVIECKLRKELTLERWMQQAESYAEPDKFTIVVSKQKNLPDTKSIVSMRLGDFSEMFDPRLLNGSE